MTPRHWVYFTTCVCTVPILVDKLTFLYYIYIYIYIYELTACVAQWLRRQTHKQ